MFRSIVELFARECKCCRSSSIPFNCGRWHWNALSRSISSLHKIAQTLGAGHGNQRIFSCSFHRRDCGFGKPFLSWIILSSIKLHEGCGRHNILRRVIEASPSGFCRWGSCLTNKLQWYPIFSVWREGRGSSCGIVFYQSTVLFFENRVWEN
jgi:hypothetical protein